MQLRQQRPILAGLLWGMLAFKPFWAVAFFPVTRYPGLRMALAMAITGLTLVALTLPVVDVQRWFDWLAIGRLATAGYDSFVTWILFSRDLQGLVRRWFLPDSIAFLPSALARASGSRCVEQRLPWCWLDGVAFRPIRGRPPHSFCLAAG